MKASINIDINKIILIVLVVLMIVPFSIDILGISLAKISTVIVGFIFLYLLIKRKDEIQELLNTKFIFFTILLSVTILLSLIANYRTIMFNDLYEAIKYIIFIIVTIVTILLCKEKENYIFLLKMVSMVMIIIGILGIIQYFNPFSINEQYITSYAPTQYETLVNDYPTPRIVGTKPNPSVYGFLVSLGIYFNLMYYKYAKKKWMVWISLALCLINLMMTLTRTIQIAFLCSLILFVLINVWIKKGWKKAVQITGITIIVFLIILLAMPSSLTWRLFQVLDFSNANSWMQRVNKWDDYLRLFSQNAFLGIGPVKNYVQEMGYIDSEWIQMLLQYGILGFATYIITLLSPIFEWIKRKENNNILKYYIPILTIVVINNISSSSLISFDTAIGFYIIIGLILTKPITNDSKSNEHSNKEEILYINYVDMNNTLSGSSVRPRKIYDAFIEEKYNIKLLSGSILKTDKKNRISKVKEVSKWLDNNVPKYCYIESPPSERILYREDRNLIKKIHRMGIKIGYFYRDAYYEFGKETIFNNQNINIFTKKYIKYILYNLFLIRDKILLKNNVDIVYFPSLSMSKYFNFKDMRVLPPAGDFVEDIQNLNAEGIIYVGGISKRYGIELLMEALDKINKKQHVILRLVCRANEVCNIKKEYQEKDWLKIYNTSNKNDLKELYNNSKIALIPIEKSKYNNFAIPIKLFEYMQYNVPIVATNNLEVRNIIEKYNIGIVTESDAEKYADAILKIYNDEELYLKLKDNEKNALLSENLWKHRVQKINEDLTTLEE